MPPWPSRLHLNHPASTSASSGPKPRDALSSTNHNHQTDNSRQDIPLHGVPVLASSDSIVPSPPRQRHGRSYSNPFSSIFSHGKRLDRTTDAELDGNVVNALDAPGSVPPALPITDSMAAANGPTSQRAQTDHVTGKCFTCGCAMRWPKELDAFRCGVCLMVNDLKPSIASLREPYTEGGTDRAESSSSVVHKKVTYLSTERTRDLIDQCLQSYLQSRLEKHLLQSEESHRTQTSERKYARQPSSLPTESYLNHGNAQATGHGVPSPLRAPPPPPPETTSPKASDSVSGAFQKSPQDFSRMIFRPLEKYIIACFTDVECLNKSFLTFRPPQIDRAVSEGSATQVCLPPRVVECTNAGNTVPTLDEKTLLLGDVAENGMWWTGRSQIERLQVQTNPSRLPESGFQDRLTMRTPRINWSEVDEWYNAILSIDHRWKDELRVHQEAKISSGNVANIDTLSVETLMEIESDIFEASAHVQRTLLKAYENVLRRPGRPLQRPEDCRFLLILLANPLLHKSEIIPSSYPVSKRFPEAKISNEYREQRRPAPSVVSPSIVHRRSPSAKMGVTGKHSGIIKRILGLMANLPSECHVYLVNWLSRYSDYRFQGLVELVGSFVTYRLTRQHGRTRSNSNDLHGGLVPSISGPGAGTSAQLHAALGVSAAPKSPDKSDSGGSYREDWQIRVSARVMSLLFTANIHGSSRPQDVDKAAFLDTGRRRSGSVARDRMQKHGQILPTSSFYNTRVDHIDLVADFETWESRRGKFSFCQYPMFLSIWAKIRIMEHDARRQMEIKAREAFFDSIMSRKAINQYLVLRVRRDCLVEDSLRGVSEVVGTGQEEIKKGLRIQFLGEEGLDSGGLRKEWFLLLVREVFDPEHGLFVYDEESRYCYFSPNSFETSDQFFLVGVVLGLAIYNSTILDVALPPFAFRKLLASAPNYTGPATSSVRSTFSHTLKDLAEFRPSLANGLKKLLEFDGNVENTFCRDFVAVTERYGMLIQVPLCTNGENRPVTNSNRYEFVDLYVKYLLDTSVARQYEPFKRGFFSVCEGNALSLFRPEEIELLVRGSDELLDVATLRSVAIYDGWGKTTSPDDEPVITWFWDSFAKSSARDQRKLLSFITSSDRIPAMGATSLVIKITCLGEHSDRFPIARTCFNMLGLYKYRLRETLENKLWRAVVESEGFGMK